MSCVLKKRAFLELNLYLRPFKIEFRIRLKIEKKYDKKHLVLL